MAEVHQLKPANAIEPIEPRIMLARDFWGYDPAPVEDIVEGLISKGIATLFAGRAGYGKSYSSQMLQTAAAVGNDWFGRKVRQCHSLGIYSEDPKDKLHDRQLKICQHYGADLLALADWASIMPNDDGNFNLFACFRRHDNGTPRTLWHQIEKRCVDDGVQLLILDNLQNIFSGDWANAQHVNSCMRWFNGRAKAMNCAIVILCNPPKDRSSYFSGIQTWENSARCTISLSAAQDEKANDIDGEFLLKVEKSNYLPYNHPLKRRGIKLIWENDVLVSPAEQEPVLLDQLGKLDLDARVIKAVSHAVNTLGWKFAADPSSPNYLPGKLASQKSWQHIAWHDLVASLDRLFTDGKLAKVAVKDVWLVRAPGDTPYPGEK